MQVSAISAMNFYGAKDNAAKRGAQAIVHDFQAIPAKIENSTKEMYGPYVEDWAVIMPSAQKASVAKPKAQVNEYVAASMHIEAPAKKELPPENLAPETYFG